MKLNAKKIGSFLFIVLSVTAVFFIAFGGKDELENALKAMRDMDIRWAFGIFMCWAVYTFFDGMNYWAYLRNQGFGISLAKAVHVALIGFYYSNITPSAAGGQPMQVNSMRKFGIPVGYGTMAVTIRFITNQFMISFLSLLFFFLNRDFVYEQLGGAMWFVRFGWLINLGSVPLVLLAAFKRNWIQSFANHVIQLLERVHIIKNREMAVTKVTDTLDTYHTALHELLRKPLQIVLQFLLSLISLMGLTMSQYFVYRAFGLDGSPWYHLLTISFLLYVSASATPLPGASGAQEGGFLLYYRNIFPEGIIGLALLVWRFFTFYLFLIVGVFTVLMEKVIVKREALKEEKETKKEENQEG